MPDRELNNNTNWKEEAMLEGIKLAVSNLQLVGSSPKEVLAESIGYLMELYEQEEMREGAEEKKDERQKGLLKKARLTIEAYIELGFPYTNYEELFERVFQKSGMTEDEILSFQQRSAKRLSLSKSSIDKVLGKWNPKCHSANKKEVIEDIMEKIKKREVGEYYYYSKKSGSSQKNIYQLVVGEDENYLCHLNMQKYYELKGETER